MSSSISVIEVVEKVRETIERALEQSINDFPRPLSVNVGICVDNNGKLNVEVKNCKYGSGRVKPTDKELSEQDWSIILSLKFSAYHGEFI